MKTNRRKVVLYNPRAVFYTMPLALLAIGSELDPEEYEVVIIDGRLDPDAEQTVLSALNDAVCLGVTVLTGAPIADALQVSRAAKAAQPGVPVVWGGGTRRCLARNVCANPVSISRCRRKARRPLPISYRDWQPARHLKDALAAYIAAATVVFKSVRLAR